MYDPKPLPIALGKACCDAVLRGWAIGGGKLVYNLLDDHTIALDLKTGKELWRTELANVANGVTMTSSAFIVGNKVFVGNSGGEMGVGGWLAALDLNTGKELWRAYSTGSDKDVKIGSKFKPFYPQYKGKDLGLATWPAGMAPARRRRGLGLHQLRSRNQPDLLWHHQIPARGFRRSGRATICGPAQSSRATPIPARRSGPISSRPTTNGTMTASTR